MNNYLFIDTETGEEFFVQADTKKDAWGVVFDIFGVNSNVSYCGVFSDEDAENMGYDTY